MTGTQNRESSGRGHLPWTGFVVGFIGLRILNRVHIPMAPEFWGLHMASVLPTDRSCRIVLLR